MSCTNIPEHDPQPASPLPWSIEGSPYRLVDANGKTVLCLQQLSPLPDPNDVAFIQNIGRHVTQLRTAAETWKRYAEYEVDGREETMQEFAPYYEQDLDGSRGVGGIPDRAIARSILKRLAGERDAALERAQRYEDALLATTVDEIDAGSGRCIP